MFVVPAYDAAPGIEINQIPQSKEEFVAALTQPEDKRVIKEKIHLSYKLQNFSKWAIQNETYDIIMSPGDYFEPYYITHRKSLMYDEIFNGWGYDKLSQVDSMLWTDHKLRMLSDTFIIHLDHSGLKNYTDWFPAFTRTMRYKMKDLSFKIFSRNMKGFLINTYYPHWLKNATVSDCSLSANPFRAKDLSEKLEFERENVMILKYCLKGMLGLWVLIIVLVNLRIKKRKVI